MKAIQSHPNAVTGYSILEGAIDRPISSEVIESFSKDTPALRSRRSRPILDFLAGGSTWEATTALIDEKYTPLTAESTRGMFGLILTDLSPNPGGFAIAVPIRDLVVPAVALKASGNRWVTGPSVLHNDNLESLIAVTVTSASVSALLRLTKDALAPILENPEDACRRLEYVRAGGAAFNPAPPDKRKWMIASLWPEWQLRQLSFAARAYDLSQRERRPPLTDGTLKKLCNRLGLRIGDATDA